MLSEEAMKKNRDVFNRCQNSENLEMIRDRLAGLSLHNNP